MPRGIWVTKFYAETPTKLAGLSDLALRADLAVLLVVWTYTSRFDATLSCFVAGHRVSFGAGSPLQFADP